VKLKQQISVKSYSGRIYAERPKSFVWEGGEREIEEVTKEWWEPGEKHFLVRTEGGEIFEICYCEAEGEWTLREIVEGGAKL
jgi:hypothetical protein